MSCFSYEATEANLNIHERSSGTTCEASKKEGEKNMNMHRDRARDKNTTTLYRIHVKAVKVVEKVASEIPTPTMKGPRKKRE